jgi:hypothetical protein
MWSARFQSLALPIFVLLVWAPVSFGQSGRRPSQPAAPSPAPNLKPESDSLNVVNESRPKIQVLVARQPTSRRLLSEDTIYAAFVQRLNEQKNVEAVGIGDLKKRDIAVKRARTETDRFVVLLQLEIDSFQGGTIVLNSPDLKISYFAFSPITGKEKYKGKVYYQAIGGARARKDAWPNGPPIKITPEAAAIAAADGLYDWLLLKTGIRER